MAAKFKPGQLLLADDLNDLDQRLAKFENMTVCPNGAGTVAVTDSNVTITISGVGNLDVWVVTGGELKQVKL